MYQLMIPLFPIDEMCHVYRKACMDSFGEHIVHCKEIYHAPNINMILLGYPYLYIYMGMSICEESCICKLFN